MRVLPGEQGTAEWHANRRGNPTASQFHRILSPAKLKLSDSSFGYMCELIAERILNADVSPDATQWMERGKILEDEAVRYYEFHREAETAKVGLCVRDLKWSREGPDGVREFAGLVGCSPDRLVGDEGGLELKCPSAAVHVGYRLGEFGTKYRLQVQGALWITGRKWWDMLSYNPDMPPALIRAYPEPEVFAALDEAVPLFLEQLRDAMERLSGAKGATGGSRGDNAVGPAHTGLVADAVRSPLPAASTPVIESDGPTAEVIGKRALIAFYSDVRKAEKVFGYPMTQQLEGDTWFVDAAVIDRSLTGTEKAPPRILVQRGNEPAEDLSQLRRLHESLKATLADMAPR